MDNKVNLDNIDKQLVNESVVSFYKNGNTQSLSLTSDGIVEKYSNGMLSGTMPFSKLGVIRECKGLVAEGYSLTLKTEATIDNQDEDKISIEDAEQTKQDLKKDIDDVKEIQTLKDELETELDKLNEDTETDNQYMLVVYTNTDGDFVPDVCIKSVDRTEYVVADSKENAGLFNKEEAEKFAELFSDKGDENHIVKAVALNDVDSLTGLYESKEVIKEELDKEFPSTDFTKQVMTVSQLKYLNLDKDLTIEQIAWLQQNIGNIYAIEDGIRNFVYDMSTVTDSEVISLDDYFNQLKLKLKGEL